MKGNTAAFNSYIMAISVSVIVTLVVTIVCLIFKIRQLTSQQTTRLANPTKIHLNNTFQTEPVGEPLEEQRTTPTNINLGSGYADIDDINANVRDHAEDVGASSCPLSPIPSKRTKIYRNNTFQAEPIDEPLEEQRTTPTNIDSGSGYADIDDINANVRDHAEDVGASSCPLPPIPSKRTKIYRSNTFQAEPIDEPLEEQRTTPTNIDLGSGYAYIDDVNPTKIYGNNTFQTEPVGEPLEEQRTTPTNIDSGSGYADIDDINANVRDYAEDVGTSSCPLPPIPSKRTKIYRSNTFQAEPIDEPLEEQRTTPTNIDLGSGYAYIDDVNPTKIYGNNSFQTEPVGEPLEEQRTTPTNIDSGTGYADIDDINANVRDHAEDVGTSSCPLPSIPSKRTKIYRNNTFQTEPIDEPLEEQRTTPTNIDLGSGYAYIDDVKANVRDRADDVEMSSHPPPQIPTKRGKGRGPLMKARETPVNSNPEEPGPETLKVYYMNLQGEDKNKSEAITSVNETASYMDLSPGRPDYAAYSGLSHISGVAVTPKPEVKCGSETKGHAYACLQKK